MDQKELQTAYDYLDGKLSDEQRKLLQAELAADKNLALRLEFVREAREAMERHNAIMRQIALSRTRLVAQT
jgi:hypothetical protein